MRLVDNFDETTGDNDADTDADLQVRIVSTGRVGDAERTVEAIVPAAPLFPSALFGDLWVNFTGTATPTVSIPALGYPNGGRKGDVGGKGKLTVGSNRFHNGSVSRAAPQRSAANIKGPVVTRRDVVSLGLTCGRRKAVTESPAELQPINRLLKAAPAHAIVLSPGHILFSQHRG